MSRMSNEEIVDAVRSFDWRAYKLEAERQVIERSKRLKLKRMIVAAGYRALAAKLHPDTGGPAAGMARLSAARDELIAELGRKPKERKRHVWTFEWRDAPGVMS